MRGTIAFYAPGEEAPGAGEEATAAAVRYFPVCGDGQHTSGIVVLTDSTPELPDEDLLKVAAPPPAGSEEEADPPEPFEWTPPSSVGNAN